MVEALLLAAPAATAYLAAAARIRWPQRRCAAFLAGLGLFVAAAAIGDDPLARHMAGHALLVCGAAPLLVLGAPVTLALRALPRHQARRLAALLHSGAVRYFVHPAVAWTGFVVAQLAFHVTPLFEVALADPIVHVVEHAVFLATALPFWACAVGADPLPGRPSAPLRALYLLAAMPAMDISGVYLMAVGHGGAGAAMLAGSMPLALAATLVAWRWLQAEESRARRSEALGATG